MNNLPEFDNSKYCLGKLCCRGHDWEGTGQSLFYHSHKSSCVECARERSRAAEAKKRAENPGIAALTVERCKKLGYVDLREIARPYGVYPSAWHPRERIRQWIEQIEQETGEPAIIAVAGSNVGTWAHPEIAAAYADWLASKVVDVEMDADLHELGELCRNKHDWRETGKSLRYSKNGVCVVCARTRNKHFKTTEKGRACRKRYELTDSYAAGKRRYRQSELRKAALRRYDQSEKGKATRQNRRKRYSQTEKGRQHKVRQLQRLKAKYEQNKNLPEYRAYNRAKARQYRLHHLERVNDYYRQWRQSERGRAARKQNEQSRRAAKLNAHFAKIPPDDLRQRLEVFGGKCGYCRSGQSESLDHFIPLSKGGSHCLSNLVPCCISCNSTKYNKDALEWYKNQSFYSAKRWKEILRLLGKTEDSYNQIPLL